VSQPRRGPDQQSASEQREHRPHKDRRSTFHRYALPPGSPGWGGWHPPEAGRKRSCEPAVNAGQTEPPRTAQIAVGSGIRPLVRVPSTRLTVHTTLANYPAPKRPACTTGITGGDAAGSTCTTDTPPGGPCTR
jgi:hypothetical protein